MYKNSFDNQSENPQVFLSCSSQELSFAIWLREALNSLGHTIYFAREDIRGGVQTFEAIHQALDRAELMILIITPESMRSVYVQSEWTYFYSERRKKLIPVILTPLEAPDRLNYLLASLQHIDFSSQPHHVALNLLHQTLQESYAELVNPTQAQISQEVSKSFATQASTEWTGRVTTEQAGLTGVYFDFPTNAFRNWLNNAQHSVSVLNTWTGVFVNYEEPLIHSVRQGASLRILLLDPSSSFAERRSLDLYEGNRDEVPRNIRTSIRQMASVYQELHGLTGSLELRLYDRMPSFSVHAVDNRVLVGFYPHSTRTTAFPLLETSRDSSLGRQVYAEYEHLWRDATPIDLSPQFPTTIADANNALVHPLTDSELEILRLICNNFSNQEIAERKVVTLATVKKHINNLYSKLEIEDSSHTNRRAKAIRRAKELGLW